MKLIFDIIIINSFSILPTNFPKIANADGMEIEKVTGMKEYSLDFYVQSSGKQKICFDNLDGSNKVLSFDFLEAEKKKDAELATKGIGMCIF